MAQKQIEKAHKNKGPSGVVLVKTPYSGKEHFVLCNATSLILTSGFVLDRACNSVIVASPYIGALFLYNLQMLSLSENQVDRDLAIRLLPRVEPRLSSTMWSRLTRNDSPVRQVLQEDKLATEAACIKGKRGPQTKFVDALRASLKDAPLSFNAQNSSPMLPISHSIALGFTWAEILPLLLQLQERASAFEKQWGWHGRDLKKTAAEIYERRKSRREQPTYVVLERNEAGKTVFEETYRNLLTAHEKATELRQQSTRVAQPWEIEISGNPRNVTLMTGEKMVLCQETRWRKGRAAISVFRTREKLIDLVSKPAQSCSSSSSSSSPSPLAIGYQGPRFSSPEITLTDD